MRPRRDHLKIFHPRRDYLHNFVRDPDETESLGTFSLETKILANQWCKVCKFMQNKDLISTISDFYLKKFKLNE